MSLDSSPGTIRPDIQTPKTIGVLNIVFALGLMVGGLGLNLAFLLVPLLGYAASVQQESQAKLAQNRQAQRERFVAEEAAAPDDATRAEVRALREQADLEGGPDEDPALRSAASFAASPQFRDPGYIGHFVADLATNLILNLLMLAAGVGLILRNAWGRSLAEAVAWLKIARLAALAISMTLVVVPIAVGLTEFLEQTMPVPGVESVVTGVKIVLVTFAWSMAGFGAIYPVVTIVALRRAQVRAAFRPSAP